MFQDHLSGLLYEEPFDPQSMLYLGDEAAPVMEALTGDLQKYIKEVLLSLLLISAMITL